MFKAHRLLYHSTLGSRVIKKKKKRRGGWTVDGGRAISSGRVFIMNTISHSELGTFHRRLG